MAASVSATGLVPKGKDAPLPLKSVSVEAQVKGFVLGLKSTLTYSNDGPDPVEVLFRFPVEKTHAVVGLTAVIDSRKIAAKVREKEAVRRRRRERGFGGAGGGEERRRVQHSSRQPSPEEGGTDPAAASRGAWG